VAPPRRILINALSLTPQGGSRSYVRNLLRELDRDGRGFDFSIIAARGAVSAAEAGRFEVLEVAVPGRGAGRTISRVLYEQLWLPVRARRFDALYCLADLAPAWGLVPTVVALRNFNIYDRRFYDTPRTRALFRMVRVGARRATRVVTPSQAAADAIGPLVGIAAERIHVIHHGIDPQAFAQEVPPIESSAPYLFLPANLERHKNIPLLFDALLQVDDPCIELWIAGGDDLDPSWAAHLKQRVTELGLEKRVRFLGPVPYQDILRYHRAAVALVFPSYIETFGHPLLEAMLAETPVVAADIPSFHEIAQDAASYFSPDDSAALAAAVDDVIADPAGSAARVERGRERASEFTWRRSVDALCAVFDAATR
jgi:glycosyltransferase involved in cell wall biosynthesis